MKKHIQRQLLGLMKSVVNGVTYIKENPQTNQTQTVYNDCNAAINMVRKTFESELSEQSYMAYKELFDKVMNGLEGSIKVQDEAVRKPLIEEAIHALHDLERTLQSEAEVNKEIVFFPYKVSMWASMEGIWRAANEDPSCDVYVVPIPHFVNGNMVYEGHLYPKDVPLIHYSAYNIEVQKPDMTYIHEPYEGSNRTLEVDIAYSTSELEKHTKELVQVPYYRSGIKIFTFWENVNGRSMPAYIKLCMDTWAKNISGAEVICINYDNLNEYIGSTYNVKKLKKVSLPCQSDLISFALLEKYGGLWLDADTIVTKDIVGIIKDMDSDGNKITMFGEHLAFIHASNPGSPALKSMVEIGQRRLNSITNGALENRKYPWDYFGNQMLTMVREQYGNLFRTIDPSIAGFIAENKLFPKVPYGPGRYQSLYFMQNNVPVNVVLSNANYGILGLHNSWTPEQYKNLNDERQILNRSEMMSKILAKVLGVR